MPTMKTAVIVLSHFYGLHGFSDRQLKRMNKAMEIFAKNKADFLIATGGFGFFNQSKISLGRRTHDYWVKNGVKDNKILFEEVSKDTRENLEEAWRLIAEKDIGEVTIVTSIDHMARAKFLANKIFPKNIIIKTVVSDYFSTWRVTIWDFFWHLAGWVKLIIREFKA